MFWGQRVTTAWPGSSVALRPQSDFRAIEFGIFEEILGTSLIRASFRGGRMALLRPLFLVASEM